MSNQQRVDLLQLPIRQRVEQELQQFQDVLRITTGTNGGTVARYEYGPFGELLTARDALAGTNPFRLSAFLPLQHGVS